MKFTMFEKETKDSKYHKNPYRIDNFDRDEKGNLICPNGKKFVYKYDKHIRGNKYGRTEEIYECEDCSGCPYKSECCKRANGNRTARLNRELTAIHHEVIELHCVCKFEIATKLIDIFFFKSIEINF